MAHALTPCPTCNANPIYRKTANHNDMTFGHATTHLGRISRFLPISHDEVVAWAKARCDQELAGDEWREILPSLRAFTAHVGHSRQETLFMGRKFAPSCRGNEREGRRACGIISMMRAITHAGVVREPQPGFTSDTRSARTRFCEPEGFEWLIANDSSQLRVCLVRQAPARTG